MKNKFFTSQQKQQRIEDKLDRYYKAFKDDDVRDVLSKMPRTQETVDLIEAELETVVQHMPGNSSREKWFHFTQGLDALVGTDINSSAKQKAIKELELKELSNKE